MANPVTYNQGTSIAGSLKSSVISVGVTPSLNISGYNWRNGFENNNIWVIYSDTYSQGQTTQGNAVPTIWATPAFTDAGLLNLINVLPARAGLTAFTVLSDAIAWLYGENKYFLSNQNYPQIVTENLLGFWDAGFSASYPNVGTVWYNLSTGVNGTLTNGPSWNNSNTKSFFVFDGTDDYCSVGNLSSTNTNYVTVSTFVKRGSDGWNGALFGFGTQASETQDVYFWGGDANRPFGFNTWNGDSWGFNNSTASGEIMDGRWHHLVAVFDRNSITTNSKIYVDGVSKSLSQVRGATQNRTVSTNFGIGLNGWNTSDQLLNGNIKSLFVYNKELDLSEILQNYYQGPIVTSGLVFNIDAANLVSYPSVGTAAYNLTGSNILTLSNGLSYQSGYGGYFLSDGTDDGLTTPDASNLDLSTFTLEGWVWWNQHKDYASLLVKGPGGNGNLFNYCFFFYAGNIVCGFGDGSSFYNVSINTPTTNTWHHIVGTYDGTTLKFYLDGVLATSNGIVATPYQNTYDLNVIQTAYPIDGRVANARVYNRALTATEVLQNYGATRGRFQFYGAYANGGTVTTLTQNGVNYRVHTFTSSGTLSVTQSGSVEVLVVAGGGSAGSALYHSGGGGAGGFLYKGGYQINDNTTITVTIGAGGAAPSTQVTKGNNGSNSVFETLTAIGGGGGGTYQNATGLNGGSGGGGGAESGIFGNGGQGTTGQGFSGGDYNGAGSNNKVGGGGGGASQAGQTGTGVGTGGNGGNGQASVISGTNTYYAGGGGGSTEAFDINTTGGLGGGGNGGPDAGQNGTVNTGGGGGAGERLSPATTGAGGSGIIIIRYPIY